MLPEDAEDLLDLAPQFSDVVQHGGVFLLRAGVHVWGTVIATAVICWR
jgi:hypothetical protein